MTHLFDPKLAIHFAAVVDAGSITAGARGLNVAQPWLSEQIRKLEQQVGERLLIRTSRKMQLTQVGREFYALAARLRDANAEAQAFAGRARQVSDQVVTVGATHFTMGFEERVALFDRFQERNPAARLAIENGRPDDIIHKLASGELDIALIHEGSQSERRDLASQGLGERSAHVLVPRDDALASRPSLTLEDLRGRQVVVSPGRTDELSRRAALAPLDAAGAVFVPGPDEDRTVIENFAARRALACLRWSLVRLKRRDLGSQVLLPILGDPLTTQIAVFRRAHDQRGKINRFFAAALEARRALTERHER